MTLRHRRFFDEVLSEGTWRRNGKLPHLSGSRVLCVERHAHGVTSQTHL